MGASGPEAEPAAARVAAALGGARDVSWFRAPGRVNLVGDHTDYNEGFVLPLAIDRDCAVAARPGDELRLRSLEYAGSVRLPAGGLDDPASVEPAWGRLAGAVAHELGLLGRPAVGMEAVLASDVPAGSGLSSSAAFEVACAVALAELAGWDPGAQALAGACREAEERATGVPCGIMDQLASLCGRPGSALLIDCRSLEIRPVALPERLAVLVVHSGVPRALEASPYAERRAACERLARGLGLRALRDATETQARDEPLVRHVVSENARVLASEDALRAGDLERLGRLLVESHASLRDDFRVSTPELDVLVAELVDAGAYGARLTGAGFGGCVVAACDVDKVAAIEESATARYRLRTGLEPRAYRCRAVAGAGPLAPPAA